MRSLVDGIAGIAKGQIGDLVAPTSILTTVSQVQPIKAYFSVSEQQYLPYAARISEVVSGKRGAGKNKILELILADGSVFPHKGAIVVADRQVDLKTGTIRFAAALTIRTMCCGRDSLPVCASLLRLPKKRCWSRNDR